jgi:hypothetical protein
MFCWMSKRYRKSIKYHFKRLVTAAKTYCCLTANRYFFPHKNVLSCREKVIAEMK